MTCSHKCLIALPRITDEMIEQFHPSLIRIGADDISGWDQLAVDFACVLRAECNRRRMEYESNKRDGEG